MSEVVCWRLCVAGRASQAFSGEGAARHGGRWNPRGVRIAYTSDSRSLAALEVLVNVDDRQRLAGMAWVCIPVVVPDHVIERPARFPPTWRQYPHAMDAQLVGGAWVREARSAAVRVPSAVVAGEFNYLLNPLHPDFQQVIIGRPEPFTFDPRLKK